MKKRKHKNNIVVNVTNITNIHITGFNFNLGKLNLYCGMLVEITINLSLVALVLQPGVIY